MLELPHIMLKAPHIMINVHIIMKQEAHGPHRSPEKTVQIIKQI